MDSRSLRHSRRHVTWFAAGVVALAVLCSTVQAAETGTINGTVSVAGSYDPDGVVVYLQGEIKGDVPKEPVRVGQRSAQFVPMFVAIAEGTSVSFANDEEQDINHNVFSRSPNWEHDLGLFPAGEQRTEVFDKAGRVKIFCSVHRRMRMEVFVAPNIYFAEVTIAAGGSAAYSIAGVPAGTYTLRVFTQNNRLTSNDQQITVTAGAPVTADFKLAVRGSN